MCECKLIVSSDTVDSVPIPLSDRPHKFVYEAFGKPHTLLDNVHLKGFIDHTKLVEIENQFGFKKGYMLIFGEKE